MKIVDDNVTQHFIHTAKPNRGSKMSSKTEDSKTSKKESISTETAELTDKALEQVNGGADKLKTKSEPVSDEVPAQVGLNYEKIEFKY